MAAAKRSKKDESELRRGEDDTREELAPGVEIVATQGDEGGPSKKVRATQKKKKFDGEKTASQLREELNLEPIAIETNPEQGVVNQGVVERELPNEPLVASDGLAPKDPKVNRMAKGPDDVKRRLRCVKMRSKR
jgi:hypothetical protein